MLPVTVTVITLNEEENLPRLLRTVDFAAQVVVVDSGSTDATQKIARDFGCEVSTRKFDGFGSQKQFALEQARQPWVLSLDADEEVSPQLHGQLENLDWDDTGSAYRIQRLNYYLGRWIRHTEWARDRPLRLFPRATSRFLPAPVHESVQHRGPVHLLPGPLKHYPYRTLGHHLEKIDHYTRLAAGADGRVYHTRDLLTRPAWKLLRNLIFQAGFLDGWQGLTVSGMSAVYEFLKIARVLEKKHAPSAP